jgi:hypothetical protein
MTGAGRRRIYAAALAAVLAAAAVVLIAIGRREAIGYDSYWHVFIARQDLWPNFWREVRDNAHPPLFYLLLRWTSDLPGSPLLVYRLVSIASTVAAAACIAAIVRRITANRSLAVLAAAAFGLSYGAVTTGLEVRAYSMCAAFTMLAFVCYLDWFAASARRPAVRASAGFAIAASIAVLTHYSTFFFIGAAAATPIALAVLSPAWRRRLAARAARHPAGTALMYGVPIAVAAAAYTVHVILWGGGRLSHVPQYMFNPAAETTTAFLWRNTLNLAAIVLPGGNEFNPGIYNPTQHVALALVAVIVVAALAQFGRPRTPRLAAVPIVVLLAMVAANAIGGLTYRYPFGGAARHEFFLVPFAVVSLFTLVECARRALPRGLRRRRIAAGGAFLGVAASIVSWGSTFHVTAQAPFQPQMDAFRRAIPAPGAVLLDQFSLINFFSHYHDWQWRAGDDYPGKGVRQTWSVTSSERRMAICRGTQWSLDMSSVETLETIVDCAHKTGMMRVALFRTHQPYTSPASTASPPGFAAFNRALAQAAGLVPVAVVADGDDLSAEFEFDPPGGRSPDNAQRIPASERPSRWQLLRWGF